VSVISGTTRELACLTLAHDDGDEPRCLVSDEDLVRQLVEEVQRLRVAAGIVEESEVDRAERIEALDDVLVEVDERQGKIAGEAHLLVELLDDAGWTLHPVRRP